MAGPSEETIVAPGKTVKLTHKLPDRAQSLGIVVLFRQIDKASWRFVTAVKPNAKNSLILRIDGLSAKLAPTKTKD